MKKYFYLLIFFSIILVSFSCKSHHQIPFKSVPNETAKLMINKYLTPDSTADTSFKEVPKRLDLDAETLKTFTEKNKDGKVEEVRFILAAYLDARPTYLKNTILLRVKRGKDMYYFYDLRVQIDQSTKAEIAGPVCPPPPDCGDN